MRISKVVKINKRLKLSQDSENEIKCGIYPKNLYFLCTSPYHKQGFEIIRGQHLTENYKNCYLLGLAKDRGIVVEYLQDIIDGIYNTKKLSHDILQQDKEQVE